jgi:hypothetical protein
MTAGRDASLPGDLAAVLDTAWQLLEAAASDLKAPLRTPVIIGLADNVPDGRVMVLRECRVASSQLIFHTDLRSPKAKNLQRDPRVAIVGYDATRLLQLRLHGRAHFQTDEAAVDAAWRATSPTARRNYATHLPPGAQLECAGDGQPESIDDATARRSFARLVVDITHLDWLELANTGHRRAQFVAAADGWTGSWRVP